MLPRLTPSGLYVGHREAIAIEGQRLDRTAARIVRGLFFCEKGHRLPDDHGINTLHFSRVREIEEVDPEAYLALQQFVTLLWQQPRKLSGGTFAYQWVQSPNGVDNTMWLLSFYGRTEYFCSTFAVADLAEASR
jgi:hypothetical protein